jgi:dTDP-4-dehydrorhamnose reductase
MTQMRMYVIGAGGMLGAFLVPYFESKDHEVMATDIDVNEQWLSRTDVRDFHAMHWDVSNFNPHVIINLAALTDLEYCDTHAGETIDTNCGGSANCAALAAKFDIPYVYISTAGIFDGKKEQYVDWDTPNPLCMYAKSKYWGELIAAAYDKGIVLRCGWQIGSCAKDKKFVNKIWKQIKAGVTELNVVTDKLGTPTYVKDFTLQIEKLLEGKHYGVFNAVCKGNASRYDVAVEIVKLLGLQDKVKVNAVGSDFWAKEYFAPRPASEKLITKRLDLNHLNVMRPWQEALAEYVNENPEYFKIGD